MEDPTGVFDVQRATELVKAARALPPAIRPLRLDDGRDLYLAYSTRELMLDRLPPGYTYVAATCGDIVVYEPARIEDLSLLHHGVGVYFYG